MATWFQWRTLPSAACGEFRFSFFFPRTGDGRFRGFTLFFNFLEHRPCGLLPSDGQTFRCWSPSRETTGCSIFFFGWPLSILRPGCESSPAECWWFGAFNRWGLQGRYWLLMDEPWPLGGQRSVAVEWKVSLVVEDLGLCSWSPEFGLWPPSAEENDHHLWEVMVSHWALERGGSC